MNSYIYTLSLFLHKHKRHILSTCTHIYVAENWKLQNILMEYKSFESLQYQNISI